MRRAEVESQPPQHSRHPDALRDLNPDRQRADVHAVMVLHTSAGGLPYAECVAPVLLSNISMQQTMRAAALLMSAVHANHICNLPQAQRGT